MFSVVVIDSASVKTRTDWDVGTGIEFASWTKTAMIARKGKQERTKIESRGSANSEDLAILATVPWTMTELRSISTFQNSKC